ncbi:RICIN domain-containing protein [Streptomyces sp. SBT349]|uniref:RICIN domain-containing protein n=1 Tax=Streptomyces sp. SBT349 TaxID=1580539 RepID=UPI000AAB02B3|nr:RICIN domain-containing protein [Streptomyces sp. SBT349]
MTSEPPGRPSASEDLSGGDLSSGDKMIVSAHSGGVLIPDSFLNKRQHLKALREDHHELKDCHRWRLTRTGDGAFVIRHVTFGRYLEPLRKSEQLVVYENIRYQGPILLETGPLAQARNVWEIRRRGDYHQIALRDSGLVVGLTHPDHQDSWVTLLDPWWSVDRLWLILDVPFA